MPRKYGRRFSRRRRFVRRTNRGSLRRTIKRTINSLAETKYRYQLLAVNNLSTTAPISYAFYNGLAVGTDSNGRIGNKVAVKAISMNFKILMNYAATGALRMRYRIIILYPRKGISTQDVTAYIAAGSINLFNRIDPSMFVVWYDRFNELSDNASASVLTDVRGNWAIHKFYKRMKGQVLNYDLSNNVDRTPILIVVSDRAAIDASAFYFAGWMSMTFKDL